MDEGSTALPADITDLVCPVDRQALRYSSSTSLGCGEHTFPVVGGIPVLLTNSDEPTHGYLSATLHLVGIQEMGDKSWMPTAVRDGLDLSREVRSLEPDEIDDFVQGEIVRTNGWLYRNALGRLTRYPIPRFRISEGKGKTLVDIGSNWGRWSLSAAREGFQVTAVDPWLPAALAGQRVARQLGLHVRFVVADARALPFADGAVDASFSYSVFQHMSEEDATRSIAEMARVTRSGGVMLVQLPNIFGLRQLQNRLVQIITRNQRRFRVRYWTPTAMRRAFASSSATVDLEVDGFFSLNPQATDIDLMAKRHALVVRTSEFLRRVSSRIPALAVVADSLYVRAVRR